MRKLKILFGVGLVLNHVAICQEEPGLDAVTVTASMTAEKISRTGRNLLVIRGENFNRLPVHSIDELLRYVPGIEVQARGPMGSQSDILLRGGTFQQVLVILDGVRINDPNTGHFSSYIPISPSEIERIEVLKGAASAIYGSEAVGGVIHIITKSFLQRKQDAGKYGFQAQVTGGEYGLVNIEAGAFSLQGKTTIHAGILSNNSKGRLQRGMRGYFHNHTASFSLGHHFNDHWSLAFRGAYDNRDFGAQNFYTSFVSDSATEKIETGWLQVSAGYHKARHRVNLNGGYKALDDTYLFNRASIANFNQSYLAQGLLTDEWKIKEHTVLTTGVQFISKAISSNDRGKHQVRQSAAFAMLNQKAGEYFTLVPALRLEYNDRSGWELVPQLNLSLRYNNIQLRGSAGKTLRDADFTERFNNYNKPFVASGRIGNPGLNEERSFSYEIGGDVFLKNFRVSGTIFQRDHSQLIDYVQTAYVDMPRKENLSPTGSYALAKNLADVKTTGAELDVQFSQKTGSSQQFIGNLGILWLESKTSDRAPSLYLSSHAKLLMNFNLIYYYGSLSLSLNGLYKKRTPQPSANPAIAKVSGDYFVLNSKLEKGLIGKHLSAFIQIDNIFDRTYTDLLGAVMPGRWLMGGFKISLTKQQP
jgi:iron complex outermembrane receptor protein